MIGDARRERRKAIQTCLGSGSPAQASPEEGRRLGQVRPKAWGGGEPRAAPRGRAARGAKPVGLGQRGPVSTGREVGASPSAEAGGGLAAAEQSRRAGRSAPDRTEEEEEDKEEEEPRCSPAGRGGSSGARRAAPERRPRGLSPSLRAWRPRRPARAPTAVAAAVAAAAASSSSSSSSSY
ncbi:unnamed protein product [Prorocentrum cordatum]|uniref:Uncharacterized protein n=1 Tax=Prorocentrum cordatum TaxID=2364126 RepID=A0ABN9W9Z5_9DINO|nr:unnamed protein product [Polarella glacialis]